MKVKGQNYSSFYPTLNQIGHNFRCLHSISGVCTDLVFIHTKRINMAKATAEVEDLLFNAAGNGNFKKVSNLFKSDKNINLGKQNAISTG